MNKFKLMLALLAAPSMVLASCGNDPAPVVDGKVTNVSVSCSQTSIMVGDSTTARANVTVTDGASKKVNWSSSDSTIATVNSSGKITGLKVGKVTITATSDVDESKKDSIEINVVAAEWSSSVKAMMEEYLGIVVPYFKGDFTWTDEYYEEYACLTAESSNSADLQKAVDAFEAANWIIEDYEDEVYASYEYNGFEYLADIYEYGGIVSVDVYAEEILLEWPSEKIADALEEQDFDVELPKFETTEGMRYSLSSGYDEEYEMGYVDILAYPDAEDSEISNLDYVGLFGASFNKEADEYGDYTITPEDKSCTIYVFAMTDDEYNVIPGFEVLVAPYVYDYSIKASVENEFVVTSKTATVSVEKLGRDLPVDAVFSFASSDPTVATVDASGVVSALKEGKVVITASYEDFASSVTLYVKDVVATEFTSAQLEVFKNIHNVDGLAVPYNAHFQSVTWEAEDSYVSIVGDSVGSESGLNYYNTLIDNDWVDLLAESGIYEYYQMLYEMFGIEITIDEIIESMLYEGITFEKEVKVDDTTSYWINADLYLAVEDEEDTEGALCVDVYDPYLYSYADAKTEAMNLIKELSPETTVDLPEALPASYYQVQMNEEEGEVYFNAFKVSGITLDDVKTALNAKNWVVDVEDIPATDEYDAYTELYGYSSDETLEIYGYLEDGVLQIIVVLPGAGSGEQVFDVEDLYDGAEVYIVSMDNGVGIGAYNGKKNFGSVSLDNPESLTVFTLNDNGDGTWQLSDENGEVYGSNSKKDIKPEGEADDCDWTIVIDENGDASIECCGWVLMYNTDAGCFKTYAEGMAQGAPVQIFIA